MTVTKSDTIANDDSLPVFARHGLDRAGLARENPDWIAEKLAAPNSRFLPVWRLKGRFVMQPVPRLGWVGREDVAFWLDQGALSVFLGLDGDIACFAIDIGDGGKDSLPENLTAQAKFIDMRMIAGNLAASQAGIVAQARSLLAWHRFHQFCGRCGSATKARSDGYARRCENPNCASDHFPRTDPVTIMMATKGDKILLGRQPVFTPGTWSCLAGYVEPGESLEDAARRELFEEAGIIGGKVTYIASQPWPYPSSLMIGMHVEAESMELTIDHQELEDALWFDRSEVLVMRDRARDPRTFQQPDADNPHLPAPVSLAWFIADHWLREGV